MEESSLIYLHLRNDIDYTETPLVPFDNVFPADETVEFIFCFELDSEQATRIDPDPSAFPGRLVFSGKRGGEDGERPANGKVRLPKGDYAFMQKRRELDGTECVNLAIELQKDALWERFSLENLMYARCLFEDGSSVIQLLRPCLGGDTEINFDGGGHAPLTPAQQAGLPLPPIRGSTP